MVFFKVLNLPLLIDELALLIFERLLGDDPVVVESLSLLLEIGQELLLLFKIGI